MHAPWSSCHRGVKLRALSVVVAAAALPALAGARPPPFASAPELEAAIAAVEHGADTATFWARVEAAGAMPLVFGDTAVFLHRSKADRVEWRGDFTGWQSTPEARGHRLGESDIWILRRSFEPDARLDYKIVETSEAWLLDPLNPNRQLGGFGPNSEVRMPGWTPPAHVVRNPKVPAGRLGPPEAVPSAKLGYAVNVRIYESARRGSARTPVLYVTDGSDYWSDEMGGLTTTLDNLVAAGRLPPLVAVFIDPWDPERKRNRREAEFVPNRESPTRPIDACPFCDFVVEELAPRVERRYRLDGKRQAILGTSLGGFNAALMGLRYPDRFSLVAIQSPSLGPQAWLPAEIARASVLPRRVAIDVGRYEGPFLADARALEAAFEGKGVKLRYREVADGHSWGHWRATAAEILEFLFAR